MLKYIAYICYINKLQVHLTGSILCAFNYISRWFLLSCGLRRNAAASWLLESRVRIPLWANMFFCHVYLCCLQRHLRRAVHSFRGVQTYVCVYVCVRECVFVSVWECECGCVRVRESVCEIVWVCDREGVCECVFVSVCVRVCVCECVCVSVWE